MENITVDLIPGYAPRAVCHVSQNDISRPIKITLKNYGERYELTGEEVLTLKVRTLRGEGITAEVENPGGDEIIIKASQEMTATQGQNLCELVIKDKSKSIGAANFCMEVEQGILIPDRRANT